MTEKEKIDQCCELLGIKLHWWQKAMIAAMHHTKRPYFLLKSRSLGFPMRNFTPEELATYRQMLLNDSQDTGINLFDE